MKFLVTECEFDLNDDYEMSKDDRFSMNELQIELEGLTVGVWDADDEDDLIEAQAEIQMDLENDAREGR